MGLFSRQSGTGFQSIAEYPKKIKPKDLHGTWSIVTGASSGIGYEFSKFIAENGGNLITISNEPEKLKQQAEDICKDYPMVTVYPKFVDLCNENAAFDVIGLIRKMDIAPLLFINNAGIFDFKSVEFMSEKRLSQYFNLHVRTLTLLTSGIARYMTEQGGGYILNMSSLSCWMPFPGIAMYSATKAYIRVFTRALRLEFLNQGVSITVACPGGIDTGLLPLPPKIRSLACALGFLDSPERFARKAIRRTFRCKAQYINGFISRMIIFFVGLMPDCLRECAKTKLLDSLEEETRRKA